MLKYLSLIVSVSCISAVSASDLSTEAYDILDSSYLDDSTDINSYPNDILSYPSASYTTPPYVYEANVLDNNIYQKPIPRYGDDVDKYIYGPTGSNPYNSKQLHPDLNIDYNHFPGAPKKEALIDRGHMRSDGGGGYYMPDGSHLRSDGMGGYHSKSGHILQDHMGIYHMPDGSYIIPDGLGGYDTKDGAIRPDGLGGYYLPDGKHMLPDGFGGFSVY